MDNSGYTRKDENPQHGYAVALASYISGDGRFQHVVVTSAPGNPSLKFTDPGFVEFQHLNSDLKYIFLVIHRRYILC